jgi:hypothetical protein
MRRFSILGLMGFVLAVAVAFAALRGANQYWAGGLLLALLGLLGYAALASIHGQGRARAAWLGFLVIGGGYLLAVRTLPTLEAGCLPTSQLMEYVERQVIGANVITVNYTSNGLVTTTSLSPPHRRQPRLRFWRRPVHRPFGALRIPPRLAPRARPAPRTSSANGIHRGR